MILLAGMRLFHPRSDPLAGLGRVPRRLRCQQLHQRADRGHQFGRIDGFREVDVKAGSQRFHAIVGSGIGGQCRGRHPPHYGIAMVPHLRDELKAVHAWHAQIGEENARRVGIQVTEGLFRRLGRRHLRASRVE